jgi:hypothetical protein
LRAAKKLGVGIPSNIPHYLLERELESKLLVNTHEALRIELERLIKEDPDRLRRILRKAIGNCEKREPPDRLRKARKKAKEIWTPIQA